jgi:ATP-binding cassette subfamily E protein 1
VLYKTNVQACVKPQYVDQIPKAVKGTVRDILKRKDDTDTCDVICDELGASIDINIIAVCVNGGIL